MNAIRPRFKRWARFLAALAVLPAAGCDELLEENPAGTLTPVNFYRNGTDAVNAVNAAYWHFHHPNIYLNHWRYVAITENPTPHLTARAAPTQGASCWDHYVCQPGDSYSSNVWPYVWSAINTANSVIDNVSAMKEIDPALQARVVGEAKFLRALHYFNLVRLWGGVPIRVTETSNLENLRMPRNTANEVYDLIIQDLTAAARDLPASYPVSDVGRATSGAAEALLGKVYLQRGIVGKADPFGNPVFWPKAQASDLPNAIEQFRKVVDSGRYALVEDYAALWDPAREVNREPIFSITNSNVNTQGSSVFAYLNPTGSGWGNSWTNSVAELPFYQSYAPEDKRRDVTWLKEYTDPKGVKRVFDPDNPRGDNYPNEGPAPRKYLHETPGLAGAATSPKDQIVVRYADVLLSLAEAINEQNGGPTGEAYQLVNQVRERAGLRPLAGGMGYAEFRRALWWERQWELSMEQQTWHDGRRFWDLYTEQVVGQARLGQTQAAKYPRLTVPQIVPEMGNRDLLHPIPQNALDRNPELIQNPGW